MSCGGSMKKMAKGGSNVEKGIYGIPNAGRTDQLGFKSGGAVKPKAKFGASVPVQRSPKPGRVRASSGVGTVSIGTRKKKGGPVVKKKALVKAQDGAEVKAGPLSEEDARAAKAFGSRAMQTPAMQKKNNTSEKIARRMTGFDNTVRSNNNFNTQEVANDFPKTSTWKGAPYLKKGGATKATKFAALAPPFNKATAADRIVGAKKNARKKK
jgi:hypothetical protein